jgi:hypothetical protein
VEHQSLRFISPSVDAFLSLDGSAAKCLNRVTVLQHMIVDWKNPGFDFLFI